MARHVEAGRDSAYPSTTRLGSDVCQRRIVSMSLRTVDHGTGDNGLLTVAEPVGHCYHRLSREMEGPFVSLRLLRKGTTRSRCSANISKGETKIADRMSPCPASLASVSEKYSLFTAGS